MIPDSLPFVEQQDHGEEFTEPLRIMLLGKSGVGKSSSGNTILGKNVFKSDMSLQRVTKFCEKVTGTVKDVPVDVTEKVNDVPVAVIDTPGFFETDRKKEDVVREILQRVTLQDGGPHVFVLVVPVGRMTQEDQDTYTLIEAKFGPRVWDYTIVLFTHGDLLGEKTINDVISESEDDLRNFIRKCTGGFHIFNNMKPEDQKQVTSFIAKIQTMVALNAGRPYNKELYPKEEKMIRERQESILAERANEISRKEKQLQERYQGEELEDFKKQLWRREEKQARLDAEKKVKTFSAVSILITILVMLVIGGVVWALTGMWPLAVISMLLCIFVKLYPVYISGKVPWLSKKNE